MNKSYINIHHSAMFAESDDDLQFASIDAAHKKRWNGATKSKLGYYCGYHYVIERNGEVTQARHESEVGAHNNKSLMNYRAVGICFAGNMSRQNLSQAQINASVKLIRDIQSRNGISDSNITPHRQYKATQCPGTNFPDPVWPHLISKYRDDEKWKVEARKWAKDNGISNGERPDDPITRVEVWQSLLNFEEYLNNK